jgi:NADH-quinone oxidoreductase subunit H
VFWFLAPFIAVLFALIPIAVIPFGTELNLPAINLGPVHIPAIRTPMQLTDLNIGVLFILGISGLGVYGVALAGWSSNNKYSLLGGLRSSAQMISYELPMALAIAAPLLALNTLSFRGIVDAQSGFFFGFLPRWTIFQIFPFNIISFILFIIAAFAETNRVPFDLPEAENELVAGFHTEYGSMKFAAFFMAEYCNMVTVSCVATLLFLGGWHPPFPAQYGSSFLPSLVMAGAGILCFLHAARPARPLDRITLPVVGVAFFALAGVFLIPAVALPLMPVIWFSAKALFILFVYIWVRGTLPRFRYDQLMRFAWTFMFPVAISNLFLTGLVVALS